MSNPRAAMNLGRSLPPAETEPPAPLSRLARRTPKASGPSKRNQEGSKEELLIERLRGGDHQAFDAIFRLYSPKLFKIVYKILGELADTEEVVQDVFLSLFRKAKSFRGKAQFSTWLYRVTVNAALARLRRRKRSKEVLYEDILPQFQSDGHHLVRPIVDWSSNVDERYANQELRKILKEAIDLLKPTDKTIVVLSDVEGLSDREIAASLGLSVSAVKTRLHRARLFLRGKLAVHLGHSPS